MHATATTQIYNEIKAQKLISQDKELDEKII